MIKFLLIFLGTFLVNSQPPLKVQTREDGSYLVLNDGSDRRYFMAGMVDNWPSRGQCLSGYSHEKMENLLNASKQMGCSAFRWNAFLKGLDFTYEHDNATNFTTIAKFNPKYIDNLEDGLNLAHEYGIMVQVVLSTAHFMTYGPGGKDGYQGGIRNGDRVAYMGEMFSTEHGTDAYIDNVIKPIAKRINGHPAFVGYNMINEPHGMTDPRDVPHYEPLDPADEANYNGEEYQGIYGASWTDEYVRLKDQRTWITKVAEAVHYHQPGALCSVAGITKFMMMFDVDGLDFYQFQYYPLVHNLTNSPFQYTPPEMVGAWGGTVRPFKPAIAGEFPVKGIDATKRNPMPLNPTEAYEHLWNNGYSGGFTWTSDVFFHLNDTMKQPIIDGYKTFRERHLKDPVKWARGGI